MQVSPEEQTLDEACRRLEAAHPGLCAAYKGFAVPRAEVEDGGFTTVELFNVPEAKKFEFVNTCYDMTRDLEADLSRPLLFMAWTESETSEHFAADVQKIRLGRGWKLQCGDKCLVVDLQCLKPDRQLKGPVTYHVRAVQEPEQGKFEGASGSMLHAPQQLQGTGKFMWVGQPVYSEKDGCEGQDLDLTFGKAA